jgi:hypothetical protein
MNIVRLRQVDAEERFRDQLATAIRSCVITSGTKSPMICWRPSKTWPMTWSKRLMSFGWRVGFSVPR